MPESTEDRPGSADATLDHMLHEVEELEGVGSKAKWVKGGIFLVVLLAVIGAIWWAQKLPGEERVVTDEGVRIALVEPAGGSLAQAPVYFKWQSVTGRYQYVLRIGTAPGQADVLEKFVKKDSVSLTDEEAAKLTPGRTYHVKVWAVDREGKKLGHAEGRFDL
jgi:hypothetical protein